MRSCLAGARLVDIVVTAVFPPLFWPRGNFEHAPPLANGDGAVVPPVLDEQPSGPGTVR